MARPRLHELAAELGVPEAEIMEFLTELPIKVRSRSTVLAESVEVRIRGRFDPEYFRPVRKPRRRVHARRPRAPHNSAPTVPTTPTVPTAQTTVDYVAPEVSGTGLLFLAPSATPAQAPSPAAPTATPAATPTATPAAAPVPVQAPTARSRPAAERRAVPAQRRAAVASDEADPEQLAKDLAEWTRRGFDEQTRQIWVDAGLRHSESSLADQCHIAGITPAELSLVLSGRSTLQRLRGGESATSVWARIAEGEQNRRKGARLGGRFALS